MFGLLKQIFVSAMIFFGFNLSNVNLWKCVSMSNQECKVRPKIININSNEPSFSPYSVKIKKWSNSCNNKSDPYPRTCVPIVVKNMNIKIFNLMPRTNEPRDIIWPETCKCKYRLDASVLNDNKEPIVINADVSVKNQFIK